MARKLRVQFEGAIYHVTVRGVDRRTIFTDDAERGRFLDRFGEAAEAYGVRVYLFCLMSNHAHLLVETPQANLSAFMHKLQTAYTVYFNLRHARKGHLMQSRFGAEPVQGDAYLLRLSRYIHLNPVFTQRMKNAPLAVRRETLRLYPWSSYRGYAGMATPYAFMDEAPILTMTGVPAKKSRQAYRRYVEAGLARCDEEFRQLLKTSVWGIGDSEFHEMIRDLHTDRARGAKRSEDVSFRQQEALVAPQAVLEAVAGAFGVATAVLQTRQYDCIARAAAVLLLGRYAGMNQRDAASLLGMGSGSAACRQLQRLRARQADDAALSERLAILHTALGQATHAEGHG